MLDTGSLPGPSPILLGGLSVSPHSAQSGGDCTLRLVPQDSCLLALRCTACLSLLCSEGVTLQTTSPSSFAAGFLLSLTVETLLVRDWRVGSREKQGIPPSLCIPGSAACPMVPTTYCVALASGLIAPAPPRVPLASGFLLLFVCALPCHPYLTFQSNNSKNFDQSLLVSFINFTLLNTQAWVLFSW